MNGYTTRATQPVWGVAQVPFWCVHHNPNKTAVATSHDNRHVPILGREDLSTSVGSTTAEVERACTPIQATYSPTDGVARAACLLYGV